MPTDGFALGRAPLAPPYAVVLISCSGLLAFIFLLLTCLCCKRGDVGFKVRGMRGIHVGRKTPARPCPPRPSRWWGRGAVSLGAPSGLELWQEPEPWEENRGTALRKMGRHPDQKDDGVSQPRVLPTPHLSRPQEFENPEGEDCSGEYTPPAEETSSSQSLPDVYILPLAEVSLPMPAPQPSHSGTLGSPHLD